MTKELEEEFSRQKQELRQIEQSYNEWEQRLNEYEEYLDQLEEFLDGDDLTKQLGESKATYLDLEKQVQEEEKSQGAFADEALLKQAEEILEKFKGFVQNQTSL